ncbi:CcmD family protein [Chloroflexota bacterium]
MENAGYLLAAFAIAWAVVFGYVLLLLNRQRGLRREINSLKESFKGKEPNNSKRKR